MSENVLLESMFNNMVVYFWMNPEDDEDTGSLLIDSDNLIVLQDLAENPSSQYRQATSFEDLKHLLDNEDISYFDMGDITYWHVHVEE